MSLEAAFLEAIRAAPSDDTLKLVYADWLDEREDPRGQILRLSVELRKVLANAEPDEEWLEWLAVQIERGLPIVLDPGEKPYRFEVAGWEFSAIVRTVTPGSFTLAEGGIIEVELQSSFTEERPHHPKPSA